VSLHRVDTAFEVAVEEAAHHERNEVIAVVGQFVQGSSRAAQLGCEVAERQATEAVLDKQRLDAVEEFIVALTACSDALCGVGKQGCKTFLAPHADGYQLHLTQLTSIGPGEGEQRLHQDREVWGGRVPLSVETQFSTIWALTDFTTENGATRVVPGSHKWEPGRQPETHEIAYAEMEAGSVLVYTGSVIHGGGRNETDTNREGLLLHNTLNWLRQEENQYLTCPPHIAQHFTPELRDLLGYPSSYGMGFFSTPFPPGEGAELVSPEALFRRPAPHWPGLGSQPTARQYASADSGPSS